MKREELLKQLQLLADKWRGKVPKDNHPDYWRYRADRCIAIRLKFQLDNLDKPTVFLPLVSDRDVMDVYA